MITPQFSCSQTAEAVAVSIYCPSVRASDAEINVDESLLTVHINPYFLRINFPHPVVEDDKSSATYDPSSGYLTVTLTKEMKGQEFPDLDLLAKLLAPRHVEVSKNLRIEVIGSETSQHSEPEEIVDSISLERREILQAAENDWQFPQRVVESSSPLQLSMKRYYGFLDMYTGYFTHVAHTENGVNELGTTPESCLPEERRAKRLEHEEVKWDEEHYMADYVDDEHIQELVVWEDRELTDDVECILTESENATILNLPRKEYLTTPSQQRNLYMTLLTLLFAYAYDRRTTQHDPTPESAWTICSLIPAFSALDPPPYTTTERLYLSVPTSKLTDDDLASTLTPSYRRSLTFPLYRSFAVADACRKDVAAVLAKGRRTVTRYLLEMKHILDHHEVYYVYSKIWVDDFCVWIQAFTSDEILFDIAERLKALNITKAMIGWNLENLEAATRLVNTLSSDSDDESSE